MAIVSGCHEFGILFNRQQRLRGHDRDALSIPSRALISESGRFNLVEQKSASNRSLYGSRSSMVPNERSDRQIVRTELNRLSKIGKDEH